MNEDEEIPDVPSFSLLSDPKRYKGEKVQKSAVEEAREELMKKRRVLLPSGEEFEDPEIAAALAGNIYYHLTYFKRKTI